ncbi:MAG: hypothetical protein ACO3ID_03010 [Candidatus Nanopelagicales bacterium]
MNLTKKIVSVAAGVALVAGMGAVAATPATAKNHAKTKTTGASVLSVPPALAAALSESGVSLGVQGAAKAAADGSTGYTNVTFPLAAKPKTDGVIPHKGALTITSEVTGVTLVYANPWIEYATSGGEGAALTGVITGLPDWMEPYSSAINGQRLPTFVIPDWAGEWKKGKIKMVSKNVYKRVDTFTGGGTVTLTDSQDSMNILNTALGTSLAPGTPIGPITTTIKNTITCNSKKACKK